MSLILTTNTSTNAPTANNVGINLPYDYVNFTTDTFNIEPNSEVAVQSVKFCKEGNIEVGRQNNQFYLWLGTKSDVDYDKTPTICHHTQLGDPGIKFEQYNNEQLAEVIKTAMDRGLKAPDMLKNNQTNSSGTEVSVLRDSEGKFTGYTIKFNYGQASGLADKKADCDFRDSLLSVDANGSWDSSVHRITKLAGKPCEMIGQVPLSHCNGSLMFDIKEAGGLFTCGLTRYLDDYALEHPTQNISYFRPQGATFYDYCVRSVFDVSAAKYYLRVFHSVIDADRGDGQEFISLQEIDYTHITPLIELFDESASYTASKISKIEWNIQNERVALYVENASGSVKHTLFDGTNASKLRNLKPAGSTLDFVYPKVRIVEDNKYITIDKANIVKPDGFIYGGNLGPAGIADGTLALGDQFEDFGAVAYHLGGFSAKLAKDCDTREMYDYHGENKDVDYAQFGNNASGAFVKPGTSATSYGVCMVLQEDIDGEDGAFYPTENANAKDILGFTDDPFAVTPNASTTISETFNSVNIPVQISTNSIFVRLNNFLQRTINGQSNGTSKIIYHVPRFDNAGNEFGGLFFEPGERVYVKLNNTEQLTRNEFSLSLVNPDETLAENITGKTIIMLHIRKSNN